ncbi:head GIN domain-containing protein [Mariniflexile litorale]|uniref:Head GIN domain-containing protein n=1 Tax=Mariniflexile litorale TaxID=3045158 RepID=A0AAU7EHM6_9FLAO|nr:head GIN domain-containing protein [Mariniflexile sp. KMM 9835]MDQ8210717.1 head GIN domain-containing protein [Mariniflexile sp. KMM 9835]
MTTLVKIIVATLISFSLFSCNFDINMNSGVKGNGHVTTENRSINKPFTAIKASEGLNVYVTQSDNESISVEADDNLQDIIITEVVDNVLKIHTKENIGTCTSKKIVINLKEVSSITATSGSDVRSTNTLVTKHLDLETTSGSDMNLDINTASLNCKSTSGSDLKLSGKTIKLIAEATSGSNIKAANLIAESSHVKATSGADITINTSKELTAKASSGGDIKYLGNPKVVNKSDSASGSIKKQ